MLQGEFSHRDNQGNEGHLKAGDIQWMKVRRGIVHEEMPIQNSCGTGFSLVGEFTIRSEIDSPKVPRCGVCTHPRSVNKVVTVRMLAGSYRGPIGPADDMAIEPDYFDIHLDQDGYFGHTIATGKTV